jgi:primosomal protein N' (replication factor Y)
VFLPFANLGLVIVDEEHEASYKQQEPAPRYNARSGAIVLANMFGAKTLLGTATPSLESYHNAKKGRYGYVQITQRYNDMQLPDIEVVDIKRLRKQKRMKGALSPVLADAMREALGRGEQVILFQNRRGYSNFVECRTCGWVPRCEHCDVSLTYHKGASRMSCHYCGAVYTLPERCPNCEEEKLVHMGAGTERVEDEVKDLFPEARVLRMDLDTTRTRTAYERIIDDFAEHRADVLVGTQMVTKGLDFDNVSIVGILDADTMLNIPDFRSYERAFHTLSQVAGRAGRKNYKGKVVLQSRSAESDIVAQVVSNDYWGMFSAQMEERKMFSYPPFCRLIYVYMRHRDNDVLEHLSADMARMLVGAFGQQRILGPAQPPVGRVQSMFIRKLIVKMEYGTSVQKVRDALVGIQRQVMSLPYSNGLVVYYDVDPV